MQDVRGRQVVEKDLSAFAISDLTAGQRKGERPAEAVAERVDFC